MDVRPVSVHGEVAREQPLIAAAVVEKDLRPGVEMPKVPNEVEHALGPLVYEARVDVRHLTAGTGGGLSGMR